ncbi:MAG TPA: hypothetical protein DCP51_02250, partial [Clostridiales bacterium]|nr:hypothetical protein [Clostridiales bacterium]
LTWQGTQLSSIFIGGPSGNEFDYNSEGLRVHKFVYNYATHFYYYYDTAGKLISEKRTEVSYNQTDTLYYIYDAAGSVIGFKHKNPSGVMTTYYYGKNA